MIRRGIFALIATGVLCCSASAQDTPLPRAKPEEVGISSARLGVIGKALNADIARGRIPGAVVAIARRGKLVYFEAFGYRDKAAAVPMTTDTIFNVASMTKPMTTVAALQLYEQGKLLLANPVANYFPKFADMKVAVMDERGENIVDTVPAARKITIQDLPRHTSGLIYGGRGTTAVHKLYPTDSASVSGAFTGAELLDKLAALPLLHQPGTVWDYGLGLDVLGLLVEQLSEQTLGGYLHDNVFKPLGMVDTHFLIPGEKAARYAKALPTNPDTGQPQSLMALTQPRKFECGGGCAAHEQRPIRRHPRARPQNRRVYAVQPDRAGSKEHGRQSRPNPRRLWLRAWTRGSYHARHRHHDGFGRGLQLAGREWHQLVGRSAGGIGRSVHGPLAGSDSLALPAGGQLTRLSGDRRLKQKPPSRCRELFDATKQRRALRKCSRCRLLHLTGEEAHVSGAQLSRLAHERRVEDGLIGSYAPTL
jgi:CubicO group peptidase (beta-lactamase class C family)